VNLPGNYKLYQNYPNPFNPVTTIKYQLPKTSEVSISVYNIVGQKVKTIVNREQPSGYYSVKWDGTNDFGQKVASSIYLYRIQTEEFTKSKKLILLR